jgi:hypothetical protein
LFRGLSVLPLTLLLAQCAGDGSVKRWRGLFVVQERAAAHELILQYSAYDSRIGGPTHYCMRSEEEWRKTLNSGQRDVPLSRLQYHCFDDADYWRIWLKTNNPFFDTRDI